MTARLRVETCMIDQTKRGKVRFTPVSTFSISIDSDEATVDGISEKVAHGACGWQPVVLFNGQNLRHMDTSSTRSKLFYSHHYSYLFMGVIGSVSLLPPSTTG